MWRTREEERGSALENTGVELSNLVLISDSVYNMSMNKTFHIFMSFVCPPPSLISVYRFTELPPDAGNI